MLTYSYFDKSDMVMRRRVAEFAKTLKEVADEEKVFDNLLAVANGDGESLLKKWLDQMALCYYPKKLEDTNDEDERFITNIPSDNMVVKRMLIKADIPVELCILDVAWILTYGYKVDSYLSEDSWGNRLDLTADNRGVRNGNVLFKKYQNQYGNWWRGGLKAANKVIDNNKNVTILNFDIKDYYHSVDFDFERFFVDYESHFPDDGIREDSLTKVLMKTYEHYWMLTRESGADAFEGTNKGKRPLPLSLLSAHILANYFLSPLDGFIREAYRPSYYGRYVDDCMIVVESLHKRSSLEEMIMHEFPGLFCDTKADEIKFDFVKEKDNLQNDDGISNLKIQKDKLYVYWFDCKLPPSSLEEFEENQRERSSEFRFLTDDADEGAVKLEEVTLVSALDATEKSGRRFNILEENKYRLAVYLAKLANRLAKYGKEYSHYDEVDKVYRYFRGSLLIKHYMLWERLLTVFVLARKDDYVDHFAEKIRIQIDSLQVAEGVFHKGGQQGKEILKQTLHRHLEQSLLMAQSLHRGEKDIDTVYLDTYMVRMHYNNYPMQEFAHNFEIEGVRLNAKELDYDDHNLACRWMPYYVKYYDIVSMLSIGYVYTPEVFKKAFDIYRELNHVENVIDETLFWNYCESVVSAVSEFNTGLSEKEKDNDKVTVSVVNMDMSDKDGENQIVGFGKVNPDKALLYQQILDSITNIPSTDIFILPEISLPLYELREYCLYAAKKERAFVAGMEYVVKNNTVYNYIVTCLPVTLYGHMDAVPVVRLKNHYAPSEIQTIHHLEMKLPEKKKKWQNLYHWRNHVFTSYYCYELANVRERSFFFSKLDAIYCPVFNPDTYYFNNIAESMVRDMHCYFIMSNVSHFGDSRVTQPTKHDNMNVMKVKGGNTQDNKSIVLSTDLEIQKLREFQLMTMAQQKIDGSFKPTPPDYDKKEVKKRMNNKFVCESY